MLEISKKISIPDNEIEITAIRSQGPGGQNVNKVSTGIHLRFDINMSTIPEFYKKRLLSLNDHHLTKAGIIIIKTQKFRTYEKNKEEAFLILKNLIREAFYTKKKRKPTKSSITKRIERKKKHSQLKSNRNKIKF